jgi:hypothetical protein
MVFIQHPSSPNIHHTEIPRRGPIRKNKKTSTPPWSWLGWVRLPMSRATGVWWASSSSLRTRFSPPLSSPTAIDGKRRSPRTQIAPHPTRAPLLPTKSQPALASRRRSRRGLPSSASAAGTRRTSPLPNPPIRSSLAVRSGAVRAVSIARRSTQASPCQARSGSPGRSRPELWDSGRPDGTVVEAGGVT